MADIIPLDQLGANAGDDGLRRDGWGRLLVVPPGGGKPVGYTRTTTVAKATDEGGGLMPWKATMAVCGTLRRRGIRAKWEALISSTGDPWYAGEKAKAECKRLVEEAAEAGGATDRREQGTALHAITAQVDRGERPQHLSAETARDIEEYNTTLAEHGITIAMLSHCGLPAVEVTVVLDSFGVGGTFDRLVRVEGRELPMIADLKTGADISYSGGSFSVQLAGYAHGEAIYEQGADPNGSTDMRAPMPAVDQREGLVIWLPAGEARCELFVVDLAAGWEGFELSLAVREWRKRRGLLAPFSQWSDVSQDKPITAPTPSGRGGTTEAAAAEIRQWLQDRINAIGRHSRFPGDQSARLDIARSWPEELPTLRASDRHSPEQLAAIEVIVDGVEGRHQMPFGAPRPGRPLTEDDRAVGRVYAAFPNTTKEQTP